MGLLLNRHRWRQRILRRLFRKKKRHADRMSLLPENMNLKTFMTDRFKHLEKMPREEIEARMLKTFQESGLIPEDEEEVRPVE